MEGEKRRHRTKRREKGWGGRQRRAVEGSGVAPPMQTSSLSARAGKPTACAVGQGGARTDRVVARGALAVTGRPLDGLRIVSARRAAWCVDAGEVALRGAYPGL